jgi:hypothetical protein
MFFMSEPFHEYCPNPKCDAPVTVNQTPGATGWCQACMEREYVVVSEPVIQDGVILSIRRLKVQWCRSSAEDVAARKERAGLLSSAPTPQQTAGPAAKRPNKIAAVLGLLAMHPDWTDKAIAEAVGCSLPNLSKNKRYRAAREAIKGQGQEARQRSRKHRGSDMDEYADAPKETLPVVTCSACGDPAGKDERGELLTHEGKYYCQGCWLEKKGLPPDYFG